MIMSSQHKPKGLSKSCVLLIVIAGMERYVFKGVASNLVTYLTDEVKMSNSLAAKTVNSWYGFTSMLPLLVAALADSYWDRFSTVLASSLLYVIGLVGLTLTALFGSWSATTGNESYSKSCLFLSLGLISLGQGGYNPSLQAFGADQLDADDEELPCTKDDKKTSNKSLFFQWWYFGVCSGSLMGVTLMAYIQDTFGWVLGFALPTIAMLVSIVFFLCGSRIYTFGSEPSRNPKFLLSLIQAVKQKVSGLVKNKISLSKVDSDRVELELQEKPLCNQNTEKENQNPATTSDSLMKNVKIVLRLVPIWTMLLTFAMIFQQPNTFFTKQGMTMKRNIGNDFKIPPATLQSTITLSIILLMPLYDKALIPITRVITRNEKGITVTQRMGIGMFLSIIAMVIAATVETKRLRISKALVSESETVPLSIFWLLPQYIILGISDIFTVVGMQEFFYSEVPVRMRTMGFALYTSVFGVGSFASALLITLVEAFTSTDGENSWFCDDMRKASLDKYYWLLAIASTVSLLLYILMCKCLKSRDMDSDNDVYK